MLKTSSIVGREHERSALRTLLTAALGGNGQVALISGEAGIGKTTLVEDLSSEAERRNVLVLSGGCYDLTTTPPYGPWLEIAGDYRRYREGAAGSQQVLPPLPESLSSPEGFASARDQNAIVEDVMRFLSTLAAVHPLMLVIEDLHWSDSASLDVLRIVARRLKDAPALLLVTYRANEVGRDSHLYSVLPLLVREARAERFDLHRLEPTAVETLVAAKYALGHTDRQKLMEYLERHAEGHPFYILELLRGLEDERLLVSLDGRWQVRDIGHQRLPALLDQMIHARLARLNDIVQERLSAASVIGQDVPLALWRDVLALPDEDVLHTVDLATAAQITDALPDGGTVRFHHALIRDALYQAIPSSRRRTLHRTIGNLLAASPNPDPDSVAWHFQMAADERAVEWLIRASERAQRSYAWTTAADRLMAANDLLSGAANSQDSGWLRYRIGRLRRHSNSVDAMRWLREALRYGERTGDAALTAYARFDLGHVQVLTGDYQIGLDQMIAGDAMLDALSREHIPVGSDIAAWVADTLPPDSDCVATPESGEPVAAINPRRGTLVQWLVEPGRLQEAQALGEPYVADIARLPATNEQIISSAADAWFGLGRIYAACCEPERARDAFSRAVQQYLSIDHHMLVAITRRNELVEVMLPYETTNIAGRRRLASLAEESIQRASGALPTQLPPRFVSIQSVSLEDDWEGIRAMLEPIVQPGVTIVAVQHYALVWLARLAREQGNVDRAWDYVQDVLPAGPHTEPSTTSFFQGIEAQLVAIDLALDSANPDLAESWLKALDRWISWSGATRWQPEAFLRWARHSLIAGDPGAARRRALEALAQANDPQQPLVLSTIHRFIGALDGSEGRHADAEQNMEQALALADACAAPFEKARTLIALASLRLVNGDDATAREYLGVAVPVLERLGAIPELERARTIADGLDEAAAHRSQPYGLSPREIEVLTLVAQGLTDADIAERLYISYRTVTTHLTSILNKLGVNSRVSATRIAVEQRLV